MDPGCVGSRWGSSRPGSVMKEERCAVGSQGNPPPPRAGNIWLESPGPAPAGCCRAVGPMCTLQHLPKVPGWSPNRSCLEQQVPTCRSSGSFCALSWCPRQRSAWERSVSLVASSDRENSSAAALSQGPCFYSPDFTGCKNHL